MHQKGILVMLSLGMIFSCLSACGGTAAPATAGSTVSVVPETTVEDFEPSEPDDGSIGFYYDDRISYGDLGGSDASLVQILDQQVLSAKVGTNDPDDAVLYLDEENGQFIAVGVGSATVDVDGVQVLVRVRPALISLFMITGHSIGAGQCGVGAQSVVCEAGTAYSSHKTSTFQSATTDMGIGYASTSRPTGIDAFAPGGGGTIGEGSGLAWKWNQITGEKVWVLNAAVGGSVISEWHKGQAYYEAAVAMYRAAALVLKNEVAAGHYLLKNTAIIYHSKANFVYKNVEYTDQVMEYWYDSMVGGFCEDLTMDITGDGTAETVQAIGFLPLWSNSKRGDYPYDTPINYYLALSDTYPNCFIVAETMRNWCTSELLKSNFPTIEYETQSEPVNMPVSTDELLAEDGVHYTQVAYNAAGLELAENLYDYFRTKVTLNEMSIYTSAGFKVKDELVFKRLGASYSLIVETSPCYASNFSIEVSDNLEVSSPFTVEAVAGGKGYINILKDGEVIRSIAVTVED